MEERKSYTLSVEFNGAVFIGVEIGQHYKEKHPDISDELILAILEQVVDGKKVDPEGDVDEDGFQYFKIEQLEFEGRWYRMILLTCQGENYLGVVNAFRVEKKK